MNDIVRISLESAGGGIQSGHNWILDSIIVAVLAIIVIIGVRIVYNAR